MGRENRYREMKRNEGADVSVLPSFSILAGVAVRLFGERCGVFAPGIC